MRYARRSTGMQEGHRWTLLTNFEKLRVYEATTEERVLAFESAEELLERFDDLMLLSKGEFLEGALDRFAARQRKPDIDNEFREVLRTWRVVLAQDLYERNIASAGEEPAVDLRLIQAAVQRLLDRLIIIQFAADVDALGEADPLRELLALTASSDGRSLIARPSLRDTLLAAFVRFDEYYNTTLFAPGHILETLAIGDAALRTVIDSVAGQSFRRLDADILGTTYEDYLAHELVVKDGRVTLDLKPEIRKAGGIYYTPKAVVAAIVDRTLRPLVEGASSVEEIDRIRVVDPACGSGSFLIRAFSVFADWYDAENQRRLERLRGGGSQTQITTEESANGPIHNYGKRILERNLYGVDLDPEAAEIATVNLVLQALRRGRQGLELGRLPMVLGQNIKVGNSVVPGFGSPPEAYVELLRERHAERRVLRDARIAVRDTPASEATLADVMATTGLVVRQELTDSLSAAVQEPQERAPFFWHIEFAEVFDPDLPEGEQGFDVMLANPPWIGFHGAKADRPYLEAHYATTTGRFDVYVPFVELGLRLLRGGGRFGMITPSNFFLRNYGDRLRPFLRAEVTIEQIIDFADEQIFAGATNYPAIMVIQKLPPPPDHELLYLRKSYDPLTGRRHVQAELADSGWVFLTNEESELFAHVREIAETTLGEICLSDGQSGLAKGIISGQNDVFLLDAADATAVRLETTWLRKAVKGQDIERWTIRPTERLLIYPYRDGSVVPEEDLAGSERMYRWLNSKREVPSAQGGLAGRGYFEASTKLWYELWNQRTEALLAPPKLLSPEVNDRPEFALVPGDVVFMDSATSATPSGASGICREYLAALLNSRLLALFHARHSVPKANGYLIYSPAFLEGLPIKLATGEGGQVAHDAIVQSVEAIIEMVTNQRALDLNFRTYVQDFAITDATVGGILSRHEPSAVESLCQDTGRLYSVAAERASDGSLLVTGRVRLSGVDYEQGQFSTIPLLRLTLPEPVATFLLRWLSTDPPIATVRAALPSLSFKAKNVLVPLMTDDERAAVVERYEPIRQQSEDTRDEISRLEAAIEAEVGELYGLSEDMRATVRSALLPAETMGMPDIVEESNGGPHA